MTRINSFDELKKLKVQLKNSTAIRTTSENLDRTVIFVGMSECGINAGSKETLTAFTNEIFEKNVENVSVVSSGGLSANGAEPVVEVRVHGKEPVKYGKIDANRAKEIISKHILEGKLVKEFIIEQGGDRK